MTATTCTFDAATGARDLDREDWERGCFVVGIGLGCIASAIGYSAVLCMGLVLGLLAWLIAFIAMYVLACKIDAGWQADKVEAVGRATGKAITKIRGLFGRR